jgi:hypothetical protein
MAAWRFSGHGRTSMTHVSTDRGEIMHFAGFHHLSPALDAGGGPAFSASAADGLARCGWEAFFGALAQRGLALSFDPSDPGSSRFIPASGARSEATRRRIHDALALARRFLAAMFGP